MSNHSHINKLKWRCHRGMLELDLILQSFLEKEYMNLSPSLQADFEKLLEIEDTELYAWLMGLERPQSHEFNKILSIIGASKFLTCL